MNFIQAYTMFPRGDRAWAYNLPTVGQLQRLQALIGGWVEAVSSSDGRVTFWVNEEGKIKGLPVNELATAFWWALCPEAVDVDTLCGTVVITGGFGPDGETLGVPDDVAKMIANTYVGDEK